MDKYYKSLSTRQLEWLVWVAVFFVIYFSLIPQDGLLLATAYTTIYTIFYVTVIYGNILFLFPRFYERGKTVQYGFLAALFVISAGVTRGWLVAYIYNAYGTGKPEPITPGNVIGWMVAGFTTFTLSFIFRIALKYFSLKQQSEKMMAQKSQAEINLLKSQVQPHFLFNTLNNIYYEVYLEAPRTAKLIERLSEIMRYFVDESPKDEVCVKTEIQFLENYIALEKIRIRHEIELNFEQNYDTEIRIPPMLLMTFVENIFKHGIDKTSSQNKINISLKQQGRYLIFETENSIYPNPAVETQTRTGIQNLRKRLMLLYQTDFVLNTKTDGNTFKAELKVPVR